MSSQILEPVTDTQDQPRTGRGRRTAPRWPWRSAAPGVSGEAVAPGLCLPSLILSVGALLIIAAGFLMRVYALGRHPYGVSSDEAWYGLDALTVLNGAHPIFFASNNGREPFFIYLAAATIGFFGRDPVGLRAAAALCGLLTIAATFLLGRAWGNRRVGLLAAAILAGMLWHIHLSRIGFRVVSLPLFIALALGLGALALQSRSRWLLVAAGVAYGLSFYTYVAARFTPLALTAMGIYGLIWHRHLLRGRARDLAWLAGPALLVALPLGVYAVRHPEIFASRADQVAIWNVAVSHGDPRNALTTNVLRTLGMFTWRGDAILRHNVPDRPVFDPLLSVLFLAGVAAALVGWRRRPAGALALIWIAVMTLPTVLAEGAPHFLRSVGVLPVVVLIPALAIDGGLRWLERRALRSAPRAPGGGVTHRFARPAASLAALIGVLVLAAGSALSARDYFGTRPASAVALSGCEYRGCYRADPKLAFDFQAPVTDLARDAAAAEGDVYLLRYFWDELSSLRFLLPESDRLRLYDPSPSLQPARPPFTLIASPQAGLAHALRLLPAGARIAVTPGSRPYFDEADPLYRLYVLWKVEPRLGGAGSRPPLARFDGKLALLDVRSSRTGDGLSLQLHWMREAGAVPAPRLQATILDAEGRVIATVHDTPGTCYYPPPYWPLGSEILHHLEVPLSGRHPRGLRLWLRLYDGVTGRSLVPGSERLTGEGKAILIPL